MNVGIWNLYEELSTKNYMLLRSEAAIGDDLLKPFNFLHDIGLKYGVHFSTLDMVVDFDALDAILFVDYPNLGPIANAALQSKAKKYLVIFESELIRPQNWELTSHNIFDRIFTWNDSLVDNKKYFKINFAHQFPDVIHRDLSNRKLCALIAGNKRIFHELELYSARMEAIRWFEENHPEDFDLYGVGWDRFRFSGSKVVRSLNRLTFLTSILAEKRISYRGVVERKRDVLEKYKFTICYENARDIPGYITEKIFDCFFAGSIPVYWGASNIKDHIPVECFIDKTEFASYEELYSYLAGMSEADYLHRVDAIEHYLASDNAKMFSAEYFAENIVFHIMS